MIELNKEYIIDSMPMVENYRDDEGPVYMLAKWHEHGLREILYGSRVLMPVYEHEDRHIVQTWLLDPNGQPMTTRRKKLMGTKYMKRLIKGSEMLRKPGDQ